MAQRSRPMAQAQIQPRLSAPLSKLRKQWLHSVRDLDPQAALAVLRQQLKAQTDEAVRLGNIAAQSWIVRQRLVGLQSALHGKPVAVAQEAPEPPVDMATTPAPTPAPEVVAQDKGDDTPAPAPTPGGPGWTKLRILVETEVNGMRFFTGSVIEVREEDAHKLIEAKSAEPVEPIAEAPPTRAARSGKKAAPGK